MALKKAVKSEARLRMAIVGPAGSGKTFTALKLATELANGKPIALFDTEHGSAVKYADSFQFDVDNIVAPFHPDKFGQAISDAVEGEYAVVVLDSLSHAWNGPGGLLTIVEQITARMRNPNSYAAWKDATPIQDRLIQSIVSANIHIIVTMRSKTDYVLQDDGRGKQAPKKVGMAPIQRDGMDYEFDVVMEMDASNTGIITKTRCSELNEGVYAKPGKQVADILKKWLSGNPAPVVQSGTNPQPPVANGQVVKELMATVDRVEFKRETPAHRQPPATPTPSPSNDNAIPPAKSAAFKRFMAEGSALFNGEWDAARHWIIGMYTQKNTPTSVRTSANELTDAELSKLADLLRDSAKWFKDEWQKQPKAQPVPA